MIHAFKLSISKLGTSLHLDSFTIVEEDWIPVTLSLIRSHLRGFSNNGQSLGNSNNFSIALGDVDDDGDLDAFVANHNQPNKVWINDGKSNFLLSAQALGGSNSLAISLGDVDGDGDLDAFVANHDQSTKQGLAE